MVQAAIPDPGPAAGEPVPRRVLLVSANIGEGHNAVGRALSEVMARTWPACEVKWVDALEAMGPGVGPLARACYVMQVEHTPWMYEFFFAAIWRHRWFLESTRAVIGWWGGRRMLEAIRRYRPDMIISTYPLGSAGLSWLRRHGRLEIPTGAWVSDFCPHPYWLYPDLDITYVMHPKALPVVAAAEPGARAAVGGLPVTGEFQPGGRSAARERLGLPPDRLVVLLSTGSLAFGNVEQAASAILAAGPQVLLVAVCGRNERLRARLEGLGEEPGRLRVLGWTDDMPGWLAAADVLVTNGGGVTVLEAMACGRPIVMFNPIAGHGRANAELMASAGLAQVCTTTAGLTRAIQRTADDTAGRQALADAALVRAADRQPADDLRELMRLPASRRTTHPVRAEDALFLHTQTENVPQQVGAVVMLEGGRLDFPTLCAAVRDRVARVPQLRHQLLPARGHWGQPRWAIEADIDVGSRIREVKLDAGDPAASLDRLIEQYFATPLDVHSHPWEMLFARDVGADGSSQDAVVVKIHHSLGDSFALISALAGLFDQAEAEARGQGETGQAEARGQGETGQAEARGQGETGQAEAKGSGGGTGTSGAGTRGRDTGASGSGVRLEGARERANGKAESRRATTPAPARPGRRAGALAGLARGRRVVAGLAGMVWAGRAQDISLSAGATGPARRFVRLSLPAREVTLTARRLHTNTADLLLALIAHALGELLAARGQATAGRTVRAMVPRNVRSRESVRRAGRPPDARPAGNRAAGVLLDLPLEPMPVDERVAAVHGLHQRRLRRGDPEAAAFVLHAMNFLPQPLQRWCARAVYTGAWISLIVSVFPGIRRQCRVLGAEIEEVYPVLALAEGTGLAVGAMTWGDSMSVGLIADAALVVDADLLASGIRRAFDACRPAGPE